MLSESQQNALYEAAQAAKASQASTGVPAALTVAQWALESGWGAHQPGNNCFGIKAYTGCYGTQTLETNEVLNGIAKRVEQEFATFRTIADCFAKHASLLTLPGPYRQAWVAYHFGSLRFEDYVREVATVYATDTGYEEELLNIAAMPEVVKVLA